MKMKRVLCSLLIAALTLVPAANAFASGDDVTTLKLVFWGTDIEKQNVLNEVVAGFEAAHPNIKVDAQHINSGDMAALSAMLAAGDPPDVSWIDPSYLPGWANDGALLDLYELMENDSSPSLKKEDYVDYAFLEYQEGKAFGTILSCEPLVLYYNPELFDEAGVEYPSADPENPWTWDQVLDAALKLTKDGNGNSADSEEFDPGSIVRYGFMFDSWHFQFDGVLNSFGGSWIAEDGSFGLTSEQGVAALQYMSDLVNKYHVAPSPLQFANMPAMYASLLSGQTAMYIDGAWGMLDLGEEGKPGQYDMAAFPYEGEENKDRPITIGLMALTAFKTDNDPDATWQLFKWLNNTEGAISQYTKGCWMPILKAYYEDEEKLAIWADNEVHTENFKKAVLGPTLENAVLSPNLNVKNFVDIDNIVSAALQKAYNGDATAEEALNEVADAANKYCDGYYF